MPDSVPDSTEDEFLGDAAHRAYLRRHGYLGPDGRLNEAGRAYQQRQEQTREADTPDATRERADWAERAHSTAGQGFTPGAELGDRLVGDGGRQERQRADQTLGHLYEDMPSADELTPEYGLLPESEAGFSHADPRFVEAQLGALGQLQDWGRGEMTSADFARRDLMRREGAQDEARQRAAVTRGLSERGLGGSGLETLGLLGAQQGNADRMSAQDAAMEVAVQDRALKAIEDVGSLSSQGREQSFGEAMGRGNAIDRFNAANTEIKNRQQDANVGARKDAYQNREDVAALQLGQYNRNADTDRATADRNRGVIGDIIGWGGDVLGADDEDT